ncbi:MAG: glycoside hydrolase [Chloroflexi bacterium]|nr:MAG: glycoside hydrolase [Phototrophicales bacterium]RMF79881.1 MAG: glycoside hydrolase [Chloroflexota bacterium]
MFEKACSEDEPTCKVTFYFPSQLSKTSVLAETVNLVGDFNGWSETETPMTKLEDGRFSVTLELERGREYQFRYLVNHSEWHNDWQADKYVPNPFMGDNSVIVVD